MKSAGTTPFLAQKTRRSHLDEFLPLYKKCGESAELGTLHKTSEKHDLSNSQTRCDTPKLRSSKQEKQPVDVSQIIIGGTNLNNSAGNNTPLNESKVTSTPLASKKKDRLSKQDKMLKKSTSTTEHNTTMEDVSVGLAIPKSQKRNKSVSFLLEEKDQAVVKKTKSDDSQDGTGDTPQTAKKHKKDKKSEKENKAEDEMNVDEPTTKKKNKKNKNMPNESKIEKTIQSVPVDASDQGGDVVKDRKFKKHGKGKKQEMLETETKKVSETPKKAKKQKHQDKNDNEGEPVCKSPKMEFIDNLENLNLGDNTHTLTNLIDEMAVVDKAKQKKLRKTANREKKQLNQNVTNIKPHNNQNVTAKKPQIQNVTDKKPQIQNVTDKKPQIQNVTDKKPQIQNVTDKKPQIQNVTDKKPQIQNVTDKKPQIQNVTDRKPQIQNETDDKDEAQTEKKKWKAKRWNKRKVAEKAQNTTINVDNLPVALLKGNFKKVLIDHFSKYGLSRSVGEPIIQNEEDPKPVFTTKVYFNSAEAATEALEMNGSSIAGHEIKVSPMRPMSETVLVVRIYGQPDKLSDKEIRAAFGEVGLIRSIKPMLRKKKTMATAFIEFDGPGAVERALQKCSTLTINGKQVMASAFTVRTNEKKKRKRGSKKKAPSNEATNSNKSEDSGSDDSDDE